MDRLRFTCFTALFAGLLFVQTAGAQTATNITAVAGNGQVVCGLCFPSGSYFQNLVVRVTDSQGQPILNKAVNWTLVSSQGNLPEFFPTTYTDGNGYSTNFLRQTSQGGNPAYTFLQSVIQASADSASVNFLETQGLSDSTNYLIRYVTATLDQPQPGETLNGTAGATGTVPIKVHVDGYVRPVPNASVRLYVDGPAGSSASASCATGANADIGSVLTDAAGNATCNVIFGPVSGSATLHVLVGGVDPNSAPGYYPFEAPVGYRTFDLPLTVRPGVAGLITIVSGNGQNVNPGQATSSLVVKVTDASGVNVIGGSTVNWSVSPAGAATVNPSSSISNGQGLASTVATLSPSAVGAITIRATTGNLSTTFTVTANVTVTGLQKVSGDAQTAASGQAFSQPLIVQVNGNTGQPVANYPVSFAVSGPASLPSTTVNTDASGRAQTIVTAGATPGAVTVTATAGAFSQSFGLTVIPPGPSLTVNGFVNGADFQRGALSPCSVATIIGAGIASTVQGVVVPGAIIGPLPYLLAGVKVSFGNSQAPIYNVANVAGQQQVTVQVPCDVTPGNVLVTVNVSGGSASITVPILPASPGVFQTVMSDGVTRLVAVRPDGSFVSIENPARRGETVRVYVTGLGPAAPPIGTNSIPVPGTDSIVNGQVIVGVNNQGTRLIQAVLARNLIGVYEVAFQVPSDASTGNDIVFSVGVNVAGDTTTRFSAGTKIPIL